MKGMVDIGVETADAAAGGTVPAHAFHLGEGRAVARPDLLQGQHLNLAGRSPLARHLRLLNLYRRYTALWVGRSL